MDKEIVFLIWFLAIGLLGTELFIPSMIAGGIGLAGLLSSIILMFAYHGPLWGGGLLLASLVSGAAIGVVASKRVAHGHTLSTQSGFVGTDDHSSLIGSRGVTATVLRPGGFATIGGRRIDVVTNGEMLPEGTPVEVVEVEGNRIQVRKVDEQG